jgi:hypothetical protein
MFYGNFAPLLSSAGLPDGFIFFPKFPVWVCFGGPSNEKRWYFLWEKGIFYSPFEYFVTIS